MNDLERQIEELTLQLQELRSRQTQLSTEMLAAESSLVKLTEAILNNGTGKERLAKPVAASTVASQTAVPYILEAKRNVLEKKGSRRNKGLHLNQELEDFIGTNVISKIGILVTIVGVFIGAKYAIDNELISPFLRILAGYAAAGVLIFLAFRLKKKYEYFSSVLIGGGLAVTYFITYIAYSFYALFPMAVAFGVMVITTGAAVAIALWYNQKVIALLGQVAAYGIPFLLGSGQGNVFVLFVYITVINFGLLMLSFKKDWKLLYHIAFFLTWLIYLLSIAVGGKVSNSFSAGLFFLAIHFFTFYLTFLSYKIFRKELYQLGEIGILLLNALFFFFLGIYLIDQQFDNIHFLTWFTIGNACIHLIVGGIIFKMNLVDKSVFQFVLGLGLLFVTVSIPIELDGNWVTVLWTLEATALTYVAYNTGRDLYLDIAVPLIVISFMSLLQDWYESYPFIRNSTVSAADFRKSSFINLNFAFSLFVCVCVGLMSFLARKFKAMKNAFVSAFFFVAWPAAFLAILYFTLYNEIHYAGDRSMRLTGDKAGFPFQSVTLIAFSCLYFAGWLFFNSKKIKAERMHHLLIVLSFFVVLAFLFDGLFSLGELREQFLTTSGASKSLLFARYISFAAMAVLWLSTLNTFKVFKPSAGTQRAVSTVFNITLLSVISNEFIHWMDLAGYQNQYKLGLSLICGMYALALLFTGIVKNRKHLRVAAMVLFAGTLLKLFFYDLTSLSTISKTIVLVILGILLLLASFLYNKYKDLLFSKEESKQ